MMTTERMTPLFEAILTCNEELALMHLEAGADPNDGVSGGCRPIHIAASTVLSPDFLKKIISAGADVNVRDDYYGQTALHMACARWQGSMEITHILIEAGADPTIVDGNGYSLADHAMMVSVNREFSYKHLGFNRNDDPPRYPFSYDENHARFILAAKEGDFEAIKSQLVNVPDKIKILALHETLNQLKYECCRLLLDNGVDPSARGIYGFTPLADAAANLELNIAGLLLSYGTDLEKGNCGGQKPLLLACQSDIYESPEDMPEQRRLNMAALLLRHGADVDGADIKGWTPLRQAVFEVNDINLTRLLLENGANPHKKDHSGITPLQLAEQNCSNEMVELLRKAQYASNSRNAVEKEGKI